MSVTIGDSPQRIAGRFNDGAVSGAARLFEMIRLVIAGIIVYVIYRFSRFLTAPSERIFKKHPGETPRVKGEELVKDPYCGTYVPLNSAHKVTRNGKTLYFCSRECLEKYMKENS